MIISDIRVSMNIENNMYDVEIGGYFNFKEVDIINKMYRKNIDITKIAAVPSIKKVIFNNPATIVLWNDGTKTVVKCQNGERFDKEKGLAMCIVKRTLGNKSNYNNIIKKYIQ